MRREDPTSNRLKKVVIAVGWFALGIWYGKFGVDVNDLMTTAVMPAVVVLMLVTAMLVLIWGLRHD